MKLEHIKHKLKQTKQSNTKYIYESNTKYVIWKYYEIYIKKNSKHKKRKTFNKCKLYKINLDEIRKSQDKVKYSEKDISDLKSSLEFTENVWEEKVKQT